MWRIGRWASLAAATVAAACLAGSAQGQTLRADPNVRLGQLPNGLRYAVVRSPTPTGAVSLRLGVDVGAFDEGEDERGVAHFVEHMAFNGTKSFAEDELNGRFARMGVGFGRDHNAFTSMLATTFHIDLPSGEPAKTEAAFRWLRDVADGMLFEPAAVVREQGVIAAEREARSEAGDAWRAKMDAFTFGALRSQARQPIGTAESVAGMTPARLKAFYDRWYRPQNAVVAVAGDADLDALEGQVRTAFSDWNGRGAAGVRAPRGQPDGERSLDHFVVSDPHAPTAASICRVRGPIGGAETERLRRNVMGDVWADVLEERLAAIAAEPQPAVLNARVYGDSWPDAALECVSVVPTRGRMAEAISRVSEEVRRFEEEGPTEAEVEEAIGELRAGYRGQIEDEATKPAPDRADALMYALLDRRTPVSGREDMRAFNAMVADLTPAEVRAAFRADWSGWGPLVRVTAAELLPDGPIRTAWSSPKAGPAVRTAAVAWPYEAFGRKGRVVSREVVAEPGFTRLKFANGVTLNFKKTAFEGGQVLVRVKLGAGRREVASEDYQLALLGATYLKEGGLGRLSIHELQSLTRGMAWDLALDVEDRAFHLDASTYATGLPGQLNILAAYLSDPGFRANLDDLIPNNVEAAFRELRSSPSEVMGEAFTQAVAPGAPINRLAPEKASAVKGADLARILKPILTTAPLQVTIVGDVDEAAVVEAMSTTLGALPPRRTAPQPRADTWYMRFPAEAPAVVRATHEGVADKAAVGLFWPLFVGEPAKRREEYALSLLGAVFADRLVSQVRERLGKSYSPEADVFLPEGTDQGYVWASVETTPADLSSVEAEVRAAAESLRRGEITEADLEAARRPKLAQLEAASSRNAWWRAMLSSADDPEELRDFLEARRLTADVSLDEVRRAAAAWLAAPPIAVVAAPSQQRVASK